MCRARGFTLIELLVALAIFAILSAFAYRGLTVMLEGRERLQAESRKWRDLAVFVGRVERDLRAALDMPAPAAGVSPAPIASTVTIAATPANGLSIVRSGSPLLESPLAAPQRVAYLLREGRVDRLQAPAIDDATREQPVPIPVLGNVRTLDFRFLWKNEWRSTWGAPGSAERLPAAVEMAVTLESGERIVRLVDVGRGP